MDILLISNEDACRSRIAQEFLYAFGRGMNILRQELWREMVFPMPYVM